MKLIKEYCQGYTIKESSDVNKYLKEYVNEDREFLIVIGLNNNNKVIYKEIVSIGTLSCSLISPREIFKGAIINSAAKIIVAHNHPAGSIEPSPEDLTARDIIRQAGEIINITLLDFVIIGNKEYKSVQRR